MSAVPERIVVGAVIYYSRRSESPVAIVGVATRFNPLWIFAISAVVGAAGLV